MARKFTSKEMEFTKVIEGRTGRIIARRGLRRTLGNPKTRNRHLAATLFEMFQKGMEQGKRLENIRIVYATAGMSYTPETMSVPLTENLTSGDSDNVSTYTISSEEAATLDDGPSTPQCSDPMSDGRPLSVVDFSDSDPRQAEPYDNESLFSLF